MHPYITWLSNGGNIYLQHNVLHLCNVLEYVEQESPQHKKASNNHANLPPEMYSFTL